MAAKSSRSFKCVVVWYCVLHCHAVCCSVAQYVSMVHCVVVCCHVLQTCEVRCFWTSKEGGGVVDRLRIPADLLQLGLIQLEFNFFTKTHLTQKTQGKKL